MLALSGVTHRYANGTEALDKARLAIPKGCLAGGAPREWGKTTLRRCRAALPTPSGGRRPRFGIAQALIGNPQWILVGESTAGLGPEEGNRFHNLIGEIGGSRAGILSTHIVDDVADLGAPMAISNGSRLRAGGRGTPGSLFRGPARGKTAGRPDAGILPSGWPGPVTFSKTIRRLT